jgi:hypothetical protein
VNLYATPTTLESVLGVTDINIIYLEAASRSIDRYCNRHFYIEQGTKYFNGDDGFIEIEDLLDLTSIKMDSDLDGVYEEEWKTEDYILYPLNKFPKTWFEASTFGSYTILNAPKVCEIIGTWGYSRTSTPYYDSGVNIITTGTDDTDLITTGKLTEGQTILVESEQMYISSYYAETSGEPPVTTHHIVVKRGINGTTAVKHDSKTAYIYEYPSEITQVCLEIASRMYETRKAQGIVSERIGDYSYTIDATPLIKEATQLSPFRRIRV